MGISGHMLGERKLRRLQALTGLPFNRAYNRNGYCEGRVTDEHGRCHHYTIDLKTGATTETDPTLHWSSCPGHFDEARSNPCHT